MNTNENVSILLVEDNQVDAMGVERAFRKLKLENNIIVAGDGISALKILREDKSISDPYLILLDLNMPRMNGIEFLEEVRRDNKLKKSVIFVLTTSSAPEDKNEAYKHNVAGYIVKGGTDGGFVDVAGLLDRYAHVCALPGQ